MPSVNGGPAEVPFETLLVKLAAVLEITQRPEGTETPQTRQELLRATKAFKDAMGQVRDFALALPGGESVIQEQTEIIAMLENLRDRKKEQLRLFSTQALLPYGTQREVSMEIDSTASTPLAQ